MYRYNLAPVKSSTPLKFIKVMEKIQLHYSNKNIPLLSERSYKLQLMDKIEPVIKRMRWKALFLINPSSENTPHMVLKR